MVTHFQKKARPNPASLSHSIKELKKRPNVGGALFARSLKELEILNSEHQFLMFAGIQQGR